MKRELVKRFTLIFVVVAALAAISAAQIPAPQPITFQGVTAVQVPLCASGCQNAAIYTTVQTYLCAANNPNAWAITGFSPIVNWNYVDDAGGSTSDTAPSYDWRNLDTALNAWLTNCPGIKLNPIVAPATEGGNNNATPLYVFNATYATNVGAAQQQDMVVSANYQGASTSPYGNANGATSCASGCQYNLNAGSTPGFVGGDATGLPVFVPGEPITIAWKNFIHQWYLHFSSAANCALGAGTVLQNDCANVASIIPSIGYARFGCVQGGECSIAGLGFWRIPPAFASLELAFVGSSSILTGQKTAPLTCGLQGTGGVLSWTQDLITFLASQNNNYLPTWSVMFDLHDNNSTPNHAYGGCTALYVSQNNLMGFGTNGAQQSDITNLASGLLTQTNWAGNFAKYPTFAHELQQLGFSDPTNGSTPCVDPNGPTGSLVNLLTFAQSHRTTIAEIYAEDLGFAYITNWSNMPSTGTACGQTNWQSHNLQATFNVYGGGAGVLNPYSRVINNFASKLYLATGRSVGGGTPDDNAYCPAGIPTWGLSDGPALLPTACYNTAIANTPAPGAVVNVSTAGQLTTALAAAVCGQRITLQAGNTFTGHFTMPALSCPSNNYLWIVTSGLANLPAESARYSTTYNGVTVWAPAFGPCYSGVSSLPGRPTLNCPGTPGTYTAQIVTPDSSPAIQFVSGTSGIRFIGLEVTRTAGTGFTATLIKPGNTGSVDHLIFDRCWIHGDENQDETETGISLPAVSWIAIVDSYMNNFYCLASIGSCVDSHPTFGGSNTTNSTTETVLKEVNNYLEGAGENFISGGGQSLTTPTDAEFRLNLMVKPLTWNPSDPSYNGGVSGHAVIAKNLFETKNFNRMLVEGNQFMQNWGGFSQGGEAWKLVAVNQQNGAQNDCDPPFSFCTASNITVRFNSIHTANSAGSVEMNVNGNGALPLGEFNFSVHDNVADNLGYATCNACATTIGMFNLLESSTVATLGQIMSGVLVNHNTWVSASGAASLLGALGLGGPTNPAYKQTNTSYQNNVQLNQTRGTYFVAGDGAVNCAFGQTNGVGMWTNCTQGVSVLSGNCFINGAGTSWPAGNVTSIATQSSVFVNWNNGSGGNYTIAAGACKAAGTDGLDPGANISKVAAVVSGSSLPSQF